MIGGSFRSSVGVGRFGTKERWGQRGLRNLTLRLINERRHRSTSLPFIGWPRRSSSSLSLSWTYLPPPLLSIIPLPPFDRLDSSHVYTGRGPARGYQRSHCLWTTQLAAMYRVGTGHGDESGFSTTDNLSCCRSMRYEPTFSDGRTSVCRAVRELVCPHDISKLATRIFSWNHFLHDSIFCDLN